MGGSASIYMVKPELPAPGIRELSQSKISEDLQLMRELGMYDDQIALHLQQVALQQVANGKLIDRH